MQWWSVVLTLLPFLAHQHYVPNQTPTCPSFLQMMVWKGMQQTLSGLVHALYKGDDRLHWLSKGPETSGHLQDWGSLSARVRSTTTLWGSCWWGGRSWFEELLVSYWEWNLIHRVYQSQYWLNTDVFLCILHSSVGGKWSKTLPNLKTGIWGGRRETGLRLEVKWLFGPHFIVSFHCFWLLQFLHGPTIKAILQLCQTGPANVFWLLELVSHPLVSGTVAIVQLASSYEHSWFANKGSCSIWLWKHGADGGEVW